MIESHRSMHKTKHLSMKKCNKHKLVRMMSPCFATKVDFVELLRIKDNTLTPTRRTSELANCREKQTDCEMLVVVKKE